MSVFFSPQLKASTMLLQQCILQVKLDHTEVTMFSLFPHFMLSASYAVRVIHSGTECNNTENVQSVRPVGKEQRCSSTNINWVINKVLRLIICLGTQILKCIESHANFMQCFSECTQAPVHAAVLGCVFPRFCR